MLEDIFSEGGKRYVYQAIRSPSEFEVPFSTSFPVLIWGSAQVSPEFRDQICEQLLRAGCRHVRAAGVQASEWDFAADLASIRLWPNEPESEANHVMTSSHEEDTLDDLAEFFVLGSSFDFHYFTEFMVLQIGDDAAVHDQLVSAVRKWAESEVRTAG